MLIQLLKPNINFSRTSILPDALQRDYQYMAFPSDQVSNIPKDPADDFRLAWKDGDKKPFLDWLQTGLLSIHFDIDDLKLHALAHYKAAGILAPHQTPPTSFGPYPDSYKTVGNIQFEAVYQPGRVPDPDAISRANWIVMETREAADRLLEILFDCTISLYGTDTPCKAWPALLRAAARGWAIM